MIVYISGQDQNLNLRTDVRMIRDDDTTSQNQNPNHITNVQIIRDDRYTPRRRYPPNCNPKNLPQADNPLVLSGCIDVTLCKNSGICPLVYFPICGKQVFNIISNCNLTPFNFLYASLIEFIGCDGQTYGNTCIMNQNAIAKYTHLGRCT